VGHAESIKPVHGRRGRGSGGGNLRDGRGDLLLEVVVLLRLDGGGQVAKAGQFAVVLLVVVVVRQNGREVRVKLE
jgi:hypothetical protein